MLGMDSRDMHVFRESLHDSPQLEALTHSMKLRVHEVKNWWKIHGTQSRVNSDLFRGRDGLALFEALLLDPDLRHAEGSKLGNTLEMELLGELRNPFWAEDPGRVEILKKYIEKSQVSGDRLVTQTLLNLIATPHWREKLDSAEIIASVIVKSPSGYSGLEDSLRILLDLPHGWEGHPKLHKIYESAMKRWKAASVDEQMKALAPVLENLQGGGHWTDPATSFSLRIPKQFETSPMAWHEAIFRRYGGRHTATWLGNFVIRVVPSMEIKNEKVQ